MERQAGRLARPPREEIEVLMTSDQVATLKVGDIVGVTQRYGYLPELKQVARRTKTQVVLQDGSKFNKYGRSVGGDAWSRRWLMTADEAKERRAETERKAKRNNAIRKLREFNYAALTDEKIEALLAHVESLTAP